MQGRTIAVKVTGGDMVELYITGEDARGVIVDVVPVLAIETRHVLERRFVGGVHGESTSGVLGTARYNRVNVQMRRGARGVRRDVSLGLAGQLSEITAMLDRISAALGVRRALRRRRRTRKAAQTASCRTSRF